MNEERNIGFVPVKTLSAVRNNLFSSGSFDDDTMSPMATMGKMVPRRCLNLSDDGTLPIFQRSSSLTTSFENSLDFSSPLSECPDVDSPIIDYIRSKQVNTKAMKRQCLSRKFPSTANRKPLHPLTLFDTNSLNSISNTSPFKSVSAENLEVLHSDLSICEMADKFPDEFQEFRMKKRNSVGRSNSAPIGNMEIDDEKYKAFGEDDIFFDDGLSRGSIFNNMSPTAPPTFFGLVDDPIVKNKKNNALTTKLDKENQPSCKDKKSANSPVFHIPSALPFKKRSMSSCSAKRTILSNDTSPLCASKKQKNKYGRSSSFKDPALLPIQLKDSLNSPRTLQRSQSFDIEKVKSPGVDITSLFDMDDKNLIGDKSKSYCLPMTSCKHPDLKAISPNTLAEVLNGNYDDVIGETIIVDCRYPYEYDGGHIKGALNIHEHQGMIDYFLKNPLPSLEKRRIIIFHCEFSSKRGPTMCRFLRNKDRFIHQHFYPKLYYPEMYLLEGGYKLFYESQKEYCEPMGYREMVNTNFTQEMRMFNRRSKSWSEDNSLRSRSLRY